MISTRTICSLAFSLLLGAPSLSEARSRKHGHGPSAIGPVATDPATTCQVLRNAYPDLTHFSNETKYEELNHAYWTAAAWLGPACIFAPTSAELMSFAVKTIAGSGVQFAIQGGGHMPIAGAANIDSSGIMLSSSGLNQLILSEDGSTVSVGPGNRWGDVYGYLEPTGKMVVGGRMGIVGVPGFLLGGGISFFSYEYGWASANIASYECVLADGRVVNATADNEFEDLYWSLRGGGNSFAIVTNFEMKTYDVPGVTIGQVTYTGSDLRDQFLQNIFDYAHGGSKDDPKSTLTPTVSRYPGSKELAYKAMLFHNGNDTNPPALANFTGNTEASLPVNESSFAHRTMKVWADEADQGFASTVGINFRFHIVSIVADLEAMGVVFDTFFEETATRLSNVSSAMVTLAMMPISEQYIVANRGDGISGDPMGIDASRAPYIWVEEMWLYANAADTPYIDSVMATVNDKIDANLAQLGDVRSPYLYLNDADRDQGVFEGYNVDNVRKMQDVRRKYDPTNVYTDLMPGGFKVAKCDTGRP